MFFTVIVSEGRVTAQTLAGFDSGYVAVNNGAAGLKEQPRPEKLKNVPVQLVFPQ